MKRLQEKKSDYQTDKLNEDWKKQKAVIKNIANFPLIVKDGKRTRKRAFSRPINLEPTRFIGKDIEIMRLRNVDGTNMVITVKLDERWLTILGDLKTDKNVKIIEIPREEALDFIEN